MKTETKVTHTPGPWKVMKGQNGGIWIIKKDYPSHEICNFGQGGADKGSEVAANARLIAAAPELLEALKSLWARIENGDLVRDISKDEDSDFAIKMMFFVNDLNKAKAAILKAEAV